MDPALQLLLGPPMGSLESLLIKMRKKIKAKHENMEAVIRSYQEMMRPPRKR
jgi:hypothetical protein